MEDGSWKVLLKKFRAQMLKLVPDWDHNMRMMSRIRNQLDPDQDILACASCGETFATKRDHLKNSKDKMTGYMRKLGDLDILKLSKEETVSFSLMDENYRQVLGVYPSDGSSESLYHLHSQYVFIPEEALGIEDHIACLCLKCNNGIKSGIPYCYSLKNGYDYGDIRRLPSHLNFRELNMAEKMVTTKAMPYSIILKLAIQHVGQRIRLASHMISFPSGGYDAISEHAKNTLPHPPEIVKQFLKINVIGAGTFSEIRSSLLMGATHVTVEGTQIYKYLK